MAPVLELSDCTVRSFKASIKGDGLEDCDRVVEDASGSTGLGGYGASSSGCASGTLRVRRVSTAFR